MPVIGSPAARVVLIVASDFQCPFCARYANDTQSTLKAAYVTPGTLQIRFLHFPLQSHLRAKAAAVVAECAAAQGAFEPLHDRLFLNPTRLTPDDLAQYAKDSGLDIRTLEDCSKGLGAARVEEARSLAATLGVSVTPTFFLGTTLEGERARVTVAFTGARPLEHFTKAIDGILGRIGA